MKKLIYSSLCLISVGFILFIFREPLLRKIGNFLIVQDTVEKVAAVFVLSGDPYNRGQETAKLFHQGYIENIYTTGSVIPMELLALSLNYDESDVTKLYLSSKLHIPENNIVALHCGTSTLEESDCILNFCREHHINKFMIISSKFHTRRISYVFKEKFKKNNIDVIIQGCSTLGYDENYWWQKEPGSIMVVLEYCKNLYYLVNY